MVDGRKVVAVGMLGSFFALAVFFNLGHYALWDDEANTALFASSVWQNGIPTARLGHNIIAFRGGAELTRCVNLFMPPLTYYFAAPFVGLLGNSAFAVRLPTALAGMASSAALFAMVFRLGGFRLAVTATAGIALNTSYILYCRQGRYYSLVLLFTTLLVWAYLERKKTGSRWLFAASATLLLFTHYFAYAGALACVALDYAIWGRKTLRTKDSVLAMILCSQVASVALVLAVMNPFGTSAAPLGNAPMLTGKVNLLWWTVRDMNSCEFGCMAFLLVVPILFAAGYIGSASLRIVTAIVLYLLLVVLLSPQPMGDGFPGVADVRYMIVAIPAFACLAALLAEHIRLPWMRYLFLTALFGSNLLHFVTGRVWSARGMVVRSTPLTYGAELLEQRSDPYNLAAQWLRSNATHEETVAVFPAHATYPLMWHAPKVRYAWQFRPEQEAVYGDLEPFHFKGKEAPDLIVAMGTFQHEAMAAIEDISRKGAVQYGQSSFIGVHYPEVFRPELFWRSFVTPEVGPQFVDGITIFRKFNK